jgi:hypothetical protein
VARKRHLAEQVANTLDRRNQIKEARLINTEYREVHALGDELNRRRDSPWQLIRLEQNLLREPNDMGVGYHALPVDHETGAFAFGLFAIGPGIAQIQRVCGDVQPNDGVSPQIILADCEYMGKSDGQNREQVFHSGSPRFWQHYDSTSVRVHTLCKK